MNHTEWLTEQTGLYEQEQQLYKQYAELLIQVLRRAAREYAPVAIVQGRAKTIASLAEKALRKLRADPKRTDPVHHFTGLSGARVIMETQGRWIICATSFGELYLIPWDALPEAIKQYDRAVVRHFPEIFAEAGFEMVKS